VLAEVRVVLHELDALGGVAAVLWQMGGGGLGRGASSVGCSMDGRREPGVGSGGIARVVTRPSPRVTRADGGVRRRRPHRGGF
jgi:hypothetical protein